MISDPGFLALRHGWGKGNVRSGSLRRVHTSDLLNVLLRCPFGGRRSTPRRTDPLLSKATTVPSNLASHLVIQQCKHLLHPHLLHAVAFPSLSVSFGMGRHYPVNPQAHRPAQVGFAQSQQQGAMIVPQHEAIQLDAKTGDSLGDDLQECRRSRCSRKMGFGSLLPALTCYQPPGFSIRNGRATRPTLPLQGSRSIVY
jgi:hypothetical protein